MPLFKSHTKNLFPFQISRNIISINLNHTVVTILLCFQNLQSLLRIRRSNNTVRNLFFNQKSSSFITFIRKRNKITKRRHSVSTPGTSISTSHRRKLHTDSKINLFKSVRKWKPHSRTSRTHMLKRSSRRKSSSFFQFLHKLPTIQSIKQINVSRSSIQNRNRKIAIFHKNPGRFLIWITTIFQF